MILDPPYQDPPLRRGRAGIGFQLPALQGRELHDRATWDKSGKPSKFIQLFSWNAGNLQRTAKCDTLNDLMASQFHIVCMQVRLSARRLHCPGAYAAEVLVAETRGDVAIRLPDASLEEHLALLQGPGRVHEEIRTMVINWPVFTDVSLSGLKEHRQMMVKQMTKFDDFDAQDFGLQAHDKDAHSPSFYIIRKSRDLTHSDLHQRSAAGKERDAERRRIKKRGHKRVHDEA